MAVVRRIYPTICECPHCADRGRHRDLYGSPQGTFRAKRCRSCKRTFRVTAIAEEHDDGGAWSKVRTL